MLQWNHEITAKDLCGGVLIATRTPFIEDGTISLDLVACHAQLFSSIPSVKGVVVDAIAGERGLTSFEEKLALVRQTRQGLQPAQIVLLHVGPLDAGVPHRTIEAKAAGADGIIGFPPHGGSNCTGHAKSDRLCALARVVDQSTLPVVIALSDGNGRTVGQSDDLAALAGRIDRVIGFDMGTDTGVIQYDHDYYALKSVSRPIACLPSSDGSMFHNLNTGADGVLSRIAFFAPYEVSQLYAAARDGHFFDAQAIHNKLAPLTRLLLSHRADQREKLCREAAILRGLLPAYNGRDINNRVASGAYQQLVTVLEQLRLMPVHSVAMSGRDADT